MALQFIMGGSGSGKTRRLYEDLIARSIREPKRQFFVIVPEQFTMQTQKEIVSLHPNHGVMNIDIVSFQRLAYRIFEELAVPSLDVLNDTGKTMILRKIGAMKSKELQLFSSQLDKPGFMGQLKSMVSELFQYSVRPEQVTAMAHEAETTLLGLKLQDLGILYQGFLTYTEQRYITTEQLLDVLCRRLPQSRLIQNSVITLDGYTGFTPVQYRLISLMMAACQDMVVTLTIDPFVTAFEKVAQSNLFHMSGHTATRLRQLAQEQQVPITESICLEQRPLHRFQHSDALDFLEQNLYRYGRREYTEPQKQIQIFQAINPQKEVAFVVDQIVRLVMEKKLRYRDIAVVTGDLGHYANEIERQFEKSQIPYFLDYKKDVMGNPMIELIRAALEVIQKNFSYEAMFRYLKTGMAGESKEDIWRLENYVMALGIRGFQSWDSQWQRVYRGQEQLDLMAINQIRSRVLEPLKAFREVFESRGTQVVQICKGIVDLLTRLSVEQQMLSYQAYFHALGAYNLAKEYQQIYGLTMDLLDQMAGLLGTEKVSRKEFGQLLDSGFEELKVGFIPATVDRIVVGDITRTRLDQIKVLFFLGVNDGVIPAAKESGGIISDRERCFLKSRQMELAPTAGEDMFMQRFYLYLMLTKPSQQLFLTYAAMSAQGKSQRPSTLIGQIKKLFPSMEVKETQDVPCFVTSPETGKRQLIQGLRDPEAAWENPGFLQLFSWYASQQGRKKELEQLLDAAFYSYRDRGIGRTASKALYGDILRGSVTRMEGYQACAYAHFLSYGLELEERQQYQVAAADLGNLFHSSIDLFFKELVREGKDYLTLEEDERRKRVHTCVTQVVSQYSNTIMESTARYQFLTGRIQKITDRTVWALCEQLKKGDFVPAGFELAFSALDHVKAMRIPISEEASLHLKGRIDRLDLCEEQDRVLVKIIDYKSGQTKFDLVDLYYGLQVQLVVYMDAVMELEQRKHPDKKVVPAGIFYYNIGDPMVERAPGMDQEMVRMSLLSQLRMNGLVNSSLDVITRLDREIEKESQVIPVAMKNGILQDARSSVATERRFADLSRFVQGQLKQAGQEILSGHIAKAPYKRGTRSACDYCPYHSVCGFDLKTQGYRYRTLKTLKPDEIWNEIEGGKDIGDQLDSRSAESH